MAAASSDTAAAAMAAVLLRTMNMIIGSSSREVHEPAATFRDDRLSSR